MQASPDHLLTLARERFAMQDYRGAIHHLLEVVETGRSFADVHHLLGVCWSMLGQTDRALAAFDRALELNARYIEAHIHRGLILNQLGRVVEAEAAFTRASAGGRQGAGGLPAAVAGELANQHAALGEVYAEIGALEEAIGQFRRAVELGVKIAINTDAHRPEHFAFRHFGVAVGQRGWLPKEQVVNTWPLEQFLAYLNKEKA